MHFSFLLIMMVNWIYVGTNEVFNDGGVMFIKVQKIVTRCEYYLISFWEEVI
jgi:hypothetical protein